LIAKYPEIDIRLVVDDLIPLIPPPSDPTPENWQRLYARYAEFLIDLKNISFETTGLKLNLDKAGLLLPAGAPLPTTATRALFDKSFQWSTNGTRIAGAPIGDPEFITQFVQEKMREADAKLEQVKILGKQAPRAAHRLLTAGATKLHTFLCNVVPPEFLLEELRQYDQARC
jgi:hypothetical protein